MNPEELFVLIRGNMELKGYHHPMSCPNREGSCNHCSLMMVDSFDRIPGDVRGLLNGLSKYLVENE